MSKPNANNLQVQSKLKESLNKLYTFEQKLFGAHTSSAKPWLYNNGATGGDEADFVYEFSDDKGVPPLATIAITPDNYLSGSIRFPSGTGSNYYQWSDQYSALADASRIEIFQKSNTYASIAASFLENGITNKYPISSFADLAAILPNAQIHCSLNVFTQTRAEAKAGVDAFKAAIEADRPVYWEMGNELDGAAYQDFANNASYPGSFPNLDPTDKAIALTIFPNGKFDEVEYANYSAEIAQYIRDNYPEDKIGLTSDYIGRWSRPDGYAGFIPLAVEGFMSWAGACMSHIDDANYDACIMHPYINLDQQWDTLNNLPFPSDGKELDESFSEMEDKGWRYQVCVSQEFLRHVMQDKNQLWPQDKEVWMTEWGNLVEADNTDVAKAFGTTDGANTNELIDSTKTFLSDGIVAGDWAINTTTEVYTTVVSVTDTVITVAADLFVNGDTYTIFTKNQPEKLVLSQKIYYSQAYYRMLYIAGMLISLCEENIKWRDTGNVTTSCFHSCLRGTGYTNSSYMTGYMNANGTTLCLWSHAIENMTHMAVPFLDDKNVQFKGLGQYLNRAIHPVRAVYFEDGSTQRIIIINVSPNTRSVNHGFSASNKWSHGDSSSPPNPYAIIPDLTYAGIADYAGVAETSDTYSCPPFSITFLENTGSYIDLNDKALVVT